MLQADDRHWFGFSLQRAYRAAAVRQRDRLQVQSFADQSFGRDGASRAVNARVRDLAKPALNRQVGGLAIDDQTILSQPAGKRNPEALPQITNEPLDFAFGLGPIGRTQPWPETTMLREIRNSG